MDNLPGVFKIQNFSFEFYSDSFMIWTFFDKYNKEEGLAEEVTNDEKAKEEGAIFLFTVPKDKDEESVGLAKERLSNISSALQTMVDDNPAIKIKDIFQLKRR